MGDHFEIKKKKKLLHPLLGLSHALHFIL